MKDQKMSFKSFSQTKNAQKNDNTAPEKPTSKQEEKQENKKETNSK